jgi:large subunit ribosomal protein L28
VPSKEALPFDALRAGIGIIVLKGINHMATCNTCGKATTFGHKRSFSQHATNRTFKPNLQKVSIMENGRMVKKTLCAKCIKTLGKSSN